MKTTAKLGDIVHRRKCYLCGKRRECRIDNRKRYFPRESPVYLIPVCLSRCSQWNCET